MARYQSQVAPDFCSQTDHLTPPKGVSTIPSPVITVRLSVLGRLPSASAVSGIVNEAQYLPTTPAILDLGVGVGGWAVATSLGSTQRVLVCEFRVPVPAISELADLRQVTATPEPQFSICTTRGLEDSDPLRCHLRAKVLLL